MILLENSAKNEDLHFRARVSLEAWRRSGLLEKIKILLRPAKNFPTSSSQKHFPVSLRAKMLESEPEFSVWTFPSVFRRWTICGGYKNRRPASMDCISVVSRDGAGKPSFSRQLIRGRRCTHRLAFRSQKNAAATLVITVQLCGTSGQSSVLKARERISLRGGGGCRGRSGGLISPA